MLRGFLIECAGQVVTDSAGFTALTETEGMDPGEGSLHKSRLYRYDGIGLEVRKIETTYPDVAIVNQWLELKNISDKPLEITRVDTVRGILAPGRFRLKYYASSWGGEFEPVEVALEGTRILECTAGRASKGMHPWFSLTGEDGSILTGSIAWSGNWIVRFEPEAEGRYRISGGLSNWLFHKQLKPGESMRAPHVIYAFLPKGSLNETSVQFGQWGRKYWYPQNALADSMPVEWNTWWPYEDHSINEAVFRENVDQCAAVGVDVCTLDAGWFGKPEAEAHWFEVRGDWHAVNTKRFPSGIRALADYTHSHGMKFGLWCEIEALGAQAELNQLRPEFTARRDGKHMGYVCLGNPQAVQWAFETLETLIRDYQADWIKLDFNLDPRAGCNRMDHGHGAGDGLYEHYMGYYRLLDRIRETYPEVLLENCASGGLRIDLGMMRHLHTTFLSDPDYSEHVLQIHWGATTMLHPSKCLHWSWSQTVKLKANVDDQPIKADMPRHKLDYMIRISMLGGVGFSYRMAELPSWVHERLKYHTDLYKDQVKALVREGAMTPLTGQALRGGRGERWNAFQSTALDSSHALVFVFRLQGGEPERVIKPVRLVPEGQYTVQFEDSGVCFDRTGRVLMEQGLCFDKLEEEGSELVFIRLRK
jgi:alpha-galactosidase